MSEEEGICWNQEEEEGVTVLKKKKRLFPRQTDDKKEGWQAGRQTSKQADR